MISWSLKPWKPIKQAKWASFSALKIDKKFGKNPVILFELRAEFKNTGDLFAL